MLSRVRIEIMGTDYTVASAEDEIYVQTLAKEIDGQVHQLLEANPKMSLNSGLVLCVLSYADSLKKSEESADHIRAQLTDYLGDSNKSRSETDELRRENEKLRRQIANLSREK